MKQSQYSILMAHLCVVCCLVVQDKSDVATWIFAAAAALWLAQGLLHQNRED